jgi:hypothetical protein
MFAMLSSEAVENNSADPLNNDYGYVSRLYKSTREKHSDIAPAQVRLFIVLKRKRDFCYAV